MKVAAIDIGTNTVLLLIADDAGGELRAELELETITRLGQDVDRTRALSEAACARTLRCLEQYRDALHAHGVQRLDVVGTSALRDARGSEAFIARAEQILGKPPRVVSGDEEARLTFSGALAGLNLTADVSVFDIGGGSTELIVGRALPQQIRASVSLDIGSVRLFERHAHGDPLLPSEHARIVADIRNALANAPEPAQGGELVGVAGTVTQLAALHFALEHYDAARVHGSRLSAQTLRSLSEELCRMPLSARRAQRGMDPGRADVIVVGALLVTEILDWARADALVVSDRGVRWGLAKDLLHSAE